MMKKTMAVLLACILVVAAAGCVSPQQRMLEESIQQLEDFYEDIGIDMDDLPDDDAEFSLWGEAEPLPESWLQYPGAEIIFYMPNAYEIDFRNMKVTSEGWSLLAPADVPPGKDGWLKVLEYYDGLAAQRGDFAGDDQSQGRYNWGDYIINIDGDTSQEDSSRFEIWFSIELIEPIDPSKPIE